MWPVEKKSSVTHGAIHWVVLRLEYTLDLRYKQEQQQAAKAAASPSTPSHPVPVAFRTAVLSRMNSLLTAS